MNMFNQVWHELSDHNCVPLMYPNTKIPAWQESHVREHLSNKIIRSLKELKSVCYTRKAKEKKTQGLSKLHRSSNLKIQRAGHGDVTSSVLWKL